jgi:cyclic pyranopterin phosphate synthase
MTKLTHLDAQGQAHMVDVSGKAVTTRTAVAEAQILMAPQTLALLREDGLPKGDVLAAARIAGIQGAKRCSDLVPLCHPLALTKVTVDFEFLADGVRIKTLARVNGQTGVEMEALTAASIAALTLYDMCKAVDRAMTINGVRLLSKQGGKSGDWQRDER